MVLVDSLIEYNVIGLSIGAIIAFVATDFFKSFTQNLIMPLIESIVKSNWEAWSISIGNTNIRIGNFLSTLLYVIIMISSTLIIFVYMVKPFLDKYTIKKSPLKEEEEEDKQEEYTQLTL